MNYRSCITLTMQVIEYLLENGWNLSNTDNFNDLHIRLEDSGFVLEEEQRLGGELTYGASKVAVSPLYILRNLFDGGEDEKDLVTVVGRNISDYKFNNAFSYVDLVNKLDLMRYKYSRGIAANVKDIDYYKFKNKYGNWPKDNYASLKNQVLSISGLDYEDLVNLRVTREGLARKIERMYQVEKLLEEHCYKIILDKKGILDIYNDDLIDFEDECRKIDLESENISWDEFCCYVRELNTIECDYVNQEYVRERRSYPGLVKITVLGLDLLALPAKPLGYKVYAKRGL